MSIRNKIGMGFIFGILLLVGLAPPAAYSQADRRITLRVADFVPPSHFLFKASTKFKEELERRTNGRVQVLLYPSGQLGKIADALTLIERGTADIAYLNPLSMPEGTFPMGATMSLPRLVPDGKTVVLAYDALIKDPKSTFRQADFERHGLRPLYLNGLAPLELMTAKKPINGIDTFKGLLMRSSGGTIALTAAAIGAEPVFINTGDIFEALQRGTVDANIHSPAAALGTSLHEVTHSITANANLGANVAAWAMTSKGYERLPADVQKAVDEAGAATTKAMADMVDDEDVRALQAFERAGAKVVELSESDLRILEERLKPVSDKWIETMKAGGFDGQAALKEARAAIDSLRSR